MRVSFVRTAGERDRFYVRRDDGSEASWSFPSYGERLPHDLVHFVVEQALAYRGGVWGAVARGADLAAISAEANRRGGKIADKYARMGDPGELLVAEALANAPWLDPEADIIAAVPPSAGLTVEKVREIRARLEELGERWRGLLPKGSIELDW
jgi:hypothetical protein